MKSIMLKILLKILFVIILLFGIGSYSNYLITGETPKLDINKPVLPDIKLSDITDSISEKYESVKEKVEPESKETYLYKWRDEKGVMHYTSEKPSGNIQNLESIKISNDTNVVPAAPNNKANTENINQPQLPSTDMPKNVYSPEGIKHLFEQAKNIQNLTNEQFNQQERVVNEN
jgi:uncharacterized protein DUF4124